VTDPAGNVTTFAYDAGDRLTTITYPPAQSGGSGTTSTFTYDSRGRRTSATDQNGQTTSYAYDSHTTASVMEFQKSAWLNPRISRRSEIPVNAPSHSMRSCD